MNERLQPLAASALPPEGGAALRRVRAGIAPAPMPLPPLDGHDGSRAQQRWRGSVGDGLRYGLLGLPLAFVALPLYVVLPEHYASRYGVPLAALGAVLLAARFADALIDPWIGRWADRLADRGPAAAWRVAVLASLVLGAGFAALFQPMVIGTAALLAWCAALLVLTCLGYSTVSVIHQAWGTRLGGDAPQRAGIVAWREGLALAGVLVASVLPSVAGVAVTSITLAVLLLIGLLALRRAPSFPAAERARPAHGEDLRLPWRVPAFRRLLALYLVNGIASAVPATLVLFFVQDRLQAPAQVPLFLASYFAAAALSMPLWVRIVRRHGLPKAWLAGMTLAVAGFVGTAALGAGDVAAFVAICLVTGAALGADLAVPGAMLTGVIQQAGHADRHEGAYVGWWTFATKLNLALAAGVALPALDLAGYAPGRTDPSALTALALAYGALPCVLKLAAATLLYRGWLRPGAPDRPTVSAPGVDP